MSNRPGALGQHVAAEIRAEMGRQNMSRRWLAEQLGQPHVTVSRWINGDGPMSFDALDAICEVLGLSAVDILATYDRGKAVPSPRPTRNRRASAAAVEAGDNRHESGRITREFVDSMAAA
jgi:transcriptional regulator with XRE-family HTH domain